MPPNRARGARPHVCGADAIYDAPASHVLLLGSTMSLVQILDVRTSGAPSAYASTAARKATTCHSLQALATLYDCAFGSATYRLFLRRLAVRARGRPSPLAPNYVPPARPCGAHSLRVSLRACQKGTASCACVEPRVDAPFVL